MKEDKIHLVYMI